MILRFVLAAALVVSVGGSVGARPAGCADHWTVELNVESFAHNGAVRSFSAQQLAAFRNRVEERLKSAIGEGCRQGIVKSADAKKIRRVEVFTASGATEPALYPDPNGSLTFEWIFAEEKLALPAAKDIVAGAACWTNPKSGACFAPGD